MNRDLILFVVLRRHEGIVANFNAIDLAGSVVSDNVFTGHVGIGESAFSAGHVLTIHVNGHLTIVSTDLAVSLKLAMDERVDLNSLSVARRDDESILRALTISAGDCFQSLLCVDDLNDSALAFKAIDCFAHFPG